MLYSGETQARHKTSERPTSEPAAEKEPVTDTGKIGTFASLGIPNFRLLISGSVLSNAAQWIQQVTLGWLAYDLTSSGTMLGSINVVRAVGSLCIIPVAGLLVDRLNRRTLITAENGCLFAFSLALGLALVSGHSNISYLFIFAFMGGLVQTVDLTLRQVLIFDVVPRRAVPNAVALMQTGWSLMRVIGPSAGGFLILWFGPGGNFLIQAGAYVLIAITIVQIKFPAKTGDANRNSPLQNIREGLQYVFKERLTRTFTLMGIIMPLLTIPVFATLPPIYAVEVFGDESGRVLGLIMASTGVGGIAGGVVTASLGKVEHRGRVQLVSLFLLSMSLIGFALTPSFFRPWS